MNTHTQTTNIHSWITGCYLDIKNLIDDTEPTQTTDTLHNIAEKLHIVMDMVEKLAEKERTK